MTKLTNPEVQLERIFNHLAETVAEMSDEEIQAEAGEDGMETDKVKRIMREAITDLKEKR